MKYILVALAFIANTTFAQLQLPDLSHGAKIIQQVGYTNFVISYQRPEARERKIMGGLVPYEKLWRTGAGRCTTISFDTDVTMSGKTISVPINAPA